MILVMPSDGLLADGSGYLSHLNADFEKWISEDVPQVLIQHIPQVSITSLFFLTGLSMGGGYGVLSIGAKSPQRFAAFSAHSAITVFEQLQNFYEPGTFTDLKRQVKVSENVFEIVEKKQRKFKPFQI